MKILEIAFGLEDLLNELENYSKKYLTSAIVNSLMHTREFDMLSPWFRYQESKWIIYLNSNDKLFIKPYEIYCEEYLNRFKQKK